MNEFYCGSIQSAVCKIGLRKYLLGDRLITSITYKALIKYLLQNHYMALVSIFFLQEQNPHPHPLALVGPTASSQELHFSVTLVARSHIQYLGNLLNNDTAFSVTFARMVLIQRYPWWVRNSWGIAEKQAEETQMEQGCVLNLQSISCC